MKILQDLSSHLLVHRGYFQKLFQRRFFDALDAAEGAQQRALAHPADTRNPVQYGMKRLPGSQPPVMRDREAMRFVAHPLQQKQRVGVAFENAAQLRDRIRELQEQELAFRESALEQGGAES